MSGENVRNIETPTSQSSLVNYEEQLKDLGLPKPPKAIHPLDRADVRKRFLKVQEWWSQEVVRQSECRTEAMVDHEIYDGPGQWTAEELAMLAERGQLPITFNQTKPTCDWVLGTEKKVRIDYRIMPRGEEDAKPAEVKTKLLKYVTDTNNAGFKRSKAFSDAVISGVGWMDFGVNKNPDEEIIHISYEDWRNVWYDTLAVEEDLSDARFLFRGKWVDDDMAIAVFPDRADVIQSSVGSLFDSSHALTGMGDPAFDSVQSGEQVIIHEGSPMTAVGTDNDPGGMFRSTLGSADATASKRRRVFIVECWYKVPVRKPVVRGKSLGVLNGSDYDATNTEIQAAIDLAQDASIVDTIKLELRHMVFVGNYVLVDRVSPYRHNRFPLVPTWGYRRKKNNTPYGMVRNLRDPQRDLNKRRSKALYILSSNRVIADSDAFTDGWQEALYQVARPDGAVKLNRRMDGKETRFELVRDNALAAEHVQLMAQDEKYIQNSSGVTDELMGRDTSAVSGKAIVARQEQGHVVTQQLFDNYRLSFKLSGEILLSMIEQFYSEEKVFRVVGSNNQPEFVQANTVNPETGEKENDITGTQADFVVSEQDYSATLRKAMFETLSEMIVNLPPEVSIQILDIVFDLSDLPGKDKLVERMRKINGQPNPDEQESDPEAQMAAEQEEMAAAQQKQQELEMQNQILQTQLATEKAKLAKMEQEAQLTAAKIKTELVNQRVRASSVDFDREKLQIERANAMHTIEMGEHQRRLEMSPANAPAKTSGKSKGSKNLPNSSPVSR